MNMSYLEKDGDSDEPVDVGMPYVRQTNLSWMLRRCSCSDKAIEDVKLFFFRVLSWIIFLFFSRR